VLNCQGRARSQIFIDVCIKQQRLKARWANKPTTQRSHLLPAEIRRVIKAKKGSGAKN
jgi:hypothetical protein